MVWVKGWYDDRVASEGQPAGQQPTGMMDLSFDMFNFNSSDSMIENYWEEIMADFNYMPAQQSGPKDAVQTNNS
jgi:hypothetical protein